MKLHLERHYQHRYGGIYKVKHISLSTVDQSQWVVYEHVYPFEQKLWHRPYDEFIDGRFTEMLTHDLMYFCSKDKDAFQLEIAAKKSAATLAKDK